MKAEKIRNIQRKLLRQMSDFQKIYDELEQYAIENPRTRCFTYRTEMTDDTRQAFILEGFSVEYIRPFSDFVGYEIRW